MRVGGDEKLEITICDIKLGGTRQTRRMKEALRRNIGRFPEDFVFELTRDE
ncbi:MAG: ORF6N domain-containing protein [Phycisphaerae bacterium]|nr:ORF6N domain-containing protein [Saprospiraceae bacterium]